MKLVGIKFEDINKYAFDYHSILHFVCGIFWYIICFNILNIFFDTFASILLTCLSAFFGSIIFEAIENGVLVDLKPHGRQDSIDNCLTDTLCVEFGCISTIFLYFWSLLATFFIVGLLFVIYVLCEIYFRKKFQRH